MRKAIVEPVFGQIKEWRAWVPTVPAARVAKSASGMEMICLTQNLLKLFWSGLSLDVLGKTRGSHA